MNRNHLIPHLNPPVHPHVRGHIRQRSPDDPLLNTAEAHLHRTARTITSRSIRDRHCRDGAFLAAQTVSAALLTLTAGQACLITWLCVLVTALAALHRADQPGRTAGTSRTRTPEPQARQVQTCATHPGAASAEPHTIDEANRLTQYDLPLLRTLGDLAERQLDAARRPSLPGVHLGSMLAAPLLAGLIFPHLTVLTCLLTALTSAAWLWQSRAGTDLAAAELRANLVRLACELKHDEQQHAEQYERFRKAQTDHLLDMILLKLDRLDRNFTRNDHRS